MKIVQSPSKKWPGEVQLSNPLTFPQVLAFEDALREVQTNKAGMSLAGFNYAMLPGVLACVEEFRITGLPAHPNAEQIPATPRLESAKFVAWLIGEITALYNSETEEIPNA